MVLDDLGNFTKDESIGWYYSEKMVLPLLDHLKIKFVLDLFDDFIEYKEAYMNAMRNMLLQTGKSVLQKAEESIFEYYKDMEELNLKYGKQIKIKKKEFVWDHIKWGHTPMVTYRKEARIAYISFECECDWEIEHGLQIVFKNGKEINKIGSYDGHLTNSDSFARPDFENKIYISRKDL